MTQPTTLSAQPGSKPELYFSTGSIPSESPHVYLISDGQPGQMRGSFDRLTVVERAALRALCAEVVATIDDEAQEGNRR